MIKLYFRAIKSKDKPTLLKVAEEVNDYYIQNYQNCKPFYLKQIQAFLYSHVAAKECWIIVSNTYGRSFSYSKFWTGFNFLSLPFLFIFRTKKEAISTLFHYYFFNICPVSDISTRLLKGIFKIDDKYIDISNSLFLSFCEVMNIRIFVNENKKMNLLEIFLQTIVTSYLLRSVSSDFNTIERFVPNRLAQYVLKRIRLSIVSSFISLICSIEFAKGMRITLEKWLFSFLKIFKTNFNDELQKITSKFDDNLNHCNNNEEINYTEEVTDHIDIKFNIAYINKINNFIQINHTNNDNNHPNKNIIHRGCDYSDLFLNVLNNGNKKKHLFRLNYLNNLPNSDKIRNAYYFKVNFVVPPKQLQCQICHHLLRKPVESCGYFFCQNCIKKYIRQHQKPHAKNPITGNKITEKSLYISQFMRYIIHKYKSFLLDDCVKEYLDENLVVNRNHS